VDTSIVLAVDADDPELPAYRRLSWDGFGPMVATVVLSPEETGDLVRATNTVSMRIAGEDPTTIIGNLGDDHVARTHAWDTAVLDALAEPGIAYGDDKLAGERVPTAPFISARIVLALGWYALPTCRHLYIDDAWRDIGQAIGRLHYLPDMVIEHRHPLAGKASRDAGYERADASAMADMAAYLTWTENGRTDDVGRVLAAL